MNRFAELLDRLAYEPGRNNKLRLITAYFRDTPDPDRGYALAALTGALSFKHAKPGLIRDLIADRTDPVLFALSYDYVGDLSETVALMWPARESCTLNSPPPCGGGSGWGVNTFSARTIRARLRHLGRRGRAEAGSAARSVADGETGSAAMEPRRRSAGRRAIKGRTPRRSQSQRLRGRNVRRMRTLLFGEKWHLHEVRHVRKHNGV